MSKLATTEVNESIFDINRYAMSWVKDRLGAFATDRLEYREMERIEFGDKLRELTTQILERKIVEDDYPVTFSYKVPSSWWQHFKRDKAPKWYTERYPVKYDNRRIKRTVKITRKATYPMADIVVPKNMGQVVIRDVVSPLSFYDEDEL